jgi:hypothetical protein
LLVAVILSIIGAVNANNSQFFNPSNSGGNSDIKNAHKYLTMASVLGSIGLIIIIIIIIVGFIEGVFRSENISKYIDNPAIPTRQDLIGALKETKQLTSTKKFQIALLITLIIITLITLTTGVFDLIAFILLGSAPSKDSPASTAYTYALLATIVGLFGIIILIVAIIIGFLINANRSKDLKQLEVYETKAEQKLKLKPSDVETEVNTKSEKIISDD